MNQDWILTSFCFPLCSSIWRVTFQSRKRYFQIHFKTRCSPPILEGVFGSPCFIRILFVFSPSESIWKSFTLFGFLYIWINISIFMFSTFRFILITYLQYIGIDWESTHLVDLGQSFVNPWNNIFGEKNKQKLPFRWLGPSISWIDVLVNGFVSTRKTFGFAEHRDMFTKKTKESEFRSMLLLIAVRPWLRACILQEIDCIHCLPFYDKQNHISDKFLFPSHVFYKDWIL